MVYGVDDVDVYAKRVKAAIDRANHGRQIIDYRNQSNHKEKPHRSGSKRVTNVGIHLS